MDIVRKPLSYGRDFVSKALGRGLPQRALNVVLEEEKRTVKSFKAVADDQVLASRNYSAWAKHEGDDLADVTLRLQDVFEQFAQAIREYAVAAEAHRTHLKGVRTRYDALSKLAKKEEHLLSRMEGGASKLEKRPSDQSMIATQAMAVKELEGMRQLISSQEADHIAQTRLEMQDAYIDLFESFTVLGKKIQLAGLCGRYLARQIPQGAPDPGADLPPYQGYVITSQIVRDFLYTLRTEFPDNSNTSRSSFDALEASAVFSDSASVSQAAPCNYTPDKTKQRISHNFENMEMLHKEPVYPTPVASEGGAYPDHGIRDSTGASGGTINLDDISVHIRPSKALPPPPPPPAAASASASSKPRNSVSDLKRKLTYQTPPISTEPAPANPLYAPQAFDPATPPGVGYMAQHCHDGAMPLPCTADAYDATTHALLAELAAERMDYPDVAAAPLRKATDGPAMQARRPSRAPDGEPASVSRQAR
ncbi:hypothetical protein SeLEV6574_g01076 [Synchytrium endobioticum]|nr:hypothetical protein SeLEV6574_g01076 [Synchytrium endobioticum]